MLAGELEESGAVRVFKCLVKMGNVRRNKICIPVVTEPGWNRVEVGRGG